MIADDGRDVPTIDQAARSAAWSTFGEVSKASAISSTDRLRRYADACFAAGNAYHAVERFGTYDEAEDGERAP